MDYKNILEEIHKEIQSFRSRGQIASYIPELAKVDPDKFGIHLHCLDGKGFSLGNNKEKFSIQSITKVWSLTMAIRMLGEEIFNRVNVEPSGNPFNSLVQLEFENGIPRNPLINSGALVVADILVSCLQDPLADFLQFVRKIAGTEAIFFNEKVARSEKEYGHRNAALASFLKSFNNLENEVETVLDFYFHQCSLEMTCEELARAFLLYTNHGKLLDTGEEILTTSQAKRLNALMQTCGFYDEAGEFSYLVGLPGKSGVGGGIAAIHPQQYSVAVWGPRLNKKGNSVLGMKALELLTTKTGYSIF